MNAGRSKDMFGDHRVATQLVSGALAGGPDNAAG